MTIKCLLLVFYTYCSSGLFTVMSNPVKTNIYDNRKYFDKYLPLYRTDPCLYSLLESIVKSNARFYSSTRYFYALDFRVNKKRRSLVISPELWRGARTLHYTGAIVIKGMTFLCKGNFVCDSLFQKEIKKKRVRLVMAKNEADLLPNFNEPSLEGSLNVCKGFPIDVNVYTKGKIAGYDDRNKW